MPTEFLNLFAAIGGDEIMGIVFFAGASLSAITWIIVGNARKIVEARHKNSANPDEVNALRHEVAHLRNMMSDVMLQLEYQKQGKSDDLAERMTPPEFKQRN